MKKAVLIALASALLFAAAASLLSPRNRSRSSSWAGLAGVQGDDYNRGIAGAFQAVIVNYWGSHIGIGIGGGFYRVTNTSGVTGAASVPDPTYQFSPTYAPKVSVIPFFINLHYKVRLASRLGLDLFAGPVFQLVQFGFRREATSSLNSLSELETFNASGTTLGLQGGLSLSFRIIRGIALVADGFFRSSKVSNITENWFLNSTSSSGTVTSSSSSYYLWYYNDTAGSVYNRIGFFDSSRPAGEGVSGARKADLNLSGLTAMIGLKLSL